MNVKAIISTGGKGTRLTELTDGIFPKGLSRLSKKFNKPLVSYQIETLLKNGIENIYISVEQPWQVVILRQSLHNKELPAATYTFGVHDWDKPLNTFRDKNLIKHIGNSDFIWTFGDMYYSPNLIKEFIATSKKNKTSVATMEYFKTSPWTNVKYFSNATVGNSKKVLSYEGSKTEGYILNPPYYFENRALKIIQNELQNTRPRHLYLQQELINKKQLSAIIPDEFVNMNDNDSMHKMIQLLEKFS